MVACTDIFLMINASIVLSCLVLGVIADTKTMRILLWMICVIALLCMGGIILTGVVRDGL